MSSAPRLTRARSAKAALLAILLGAAPPASALLDLTGTGEGTFRCKDVTNGVVTKPKGAVTMTVTQGGGTVFATIAPEGFGAFPFQGLLQELGEKPGQGATTLLACGTEAGSSSYAEGVSAQVKVNQRDPSKATFKASSTYEGPRELRGRGYV